MNSNDLKLNQIQVIGSHNSYRIHPVQDMFNLMTGLNPELAAGLDYGHPSFDVQFSQHGIRQIEIDVYHDPEGGLFYNQRGNLFIGLPVPSGIEELLDPGLKVLHFPDIDYRTHYLTSIIMQKNLHSAAGLVFASTSIFFTITLGSVSVDAHQNSRI